LCQWFNSTSRHHKSRNKENKKTKKQGGNMLKIKSIFNLMIFSIVVSGTVFGFKWNDGYKKAKEKNKEISFTQYVKTDINEITNSLKEIPSMMKEVAVSKGNMQKAYVDRLSSVIEMYAGDHGEYPNDLSDLVGEYITEKTLNQEGLHYQQRWGGYEIGIELSNGEYYIIKSWE